MNLEKHLLKKTNEDKNNHHNNNNNQWQFQDPKMEVLYHIRPYFVGIFPYIGLT